MNGRDVTLTLATAAGALAAAGIISLTASAVASADGDDPSPVDTDFISHTDNFGFFTDTVAADPDDHFDAMVFQIPALGITDVLTSGADPSDSLGLGAAGEGVAGETVNTYLNTMDPALDSTFALPFTDPLAQLFTDFIPFGF